MRNVELDSSIEPHGGYLLPEQVLHDHSLHFFQSGALAVGLDKRETVLIDACDLVHVLFSPSRAARAPVEDPHDGVLPKLPGTVGQMLRHGFVFSLQPRGGCAVRANRGVERARAGGHRPFSVKVAFLRQGGIGSFLLLGRGIVDVGSIHIPHHRNTREEQCRNDHRRSNETA